MIAFEVQRGQVTSERNFAARIERIRQVSTSRISEWPQEQSPEKRIRRVAVAQPFKIGDNDINIGGLELCECATRNRSVDGVNRVRNDDDPDIGISLLLLQKQVRQLSGQRALWAGYPHLKVVVEKHVQQYQVPGIADHLERGIEYLLAIVLCTLCIHPGHVGQERDVGGSVHSACE